MQDTDVFVKTDAGRDEIKSRGHGLSMAARAILLMVDGQRNVAALRSVIAGSKAPADTLDALTAQGLIELKSAVGAAAAPSSIGTPRIATMGRPAPGPVAAPSAITPAGARPAPPAAGSADPARSVFDGPLDLTLPTVYGSETWSAPAAGAPESGVASARTSKDRYEHLYAMLNEVVRDFLPAHRRYLIQLKIERAGTPEELLELLEPVRAALVKAKGEEFAASVVARVRAAAA